MCVRLIRNQQRYNWVNPDSLVTLRGENMGAKKMHYFKDLIEDRFKEHIDEDGVVVGHDEIFTTPNKQRGTDQTIIQRDLDGQEQGRAYRHTWVSGDGHFHEVVRSFDKNGNWTSTKHGEGWFSPGGHEHTKSWETYARAQDEKNAPVGTGPTGRGFETERWTSRNGTRHETTTEKTRWHEFDGPNVGVHNKSVTTETLTSKNGQIHATPPVERHSVTAPDNSTYDLNHAVPSYSPSPNSLPPPPPPPIQPHSRIDRPGLPGVGVEKLVDASAGPLGPPHDDYTAGPLGPSHDAYTAGPLGPPHDDYTAGPLGPPHDDYTAGPVGPPDDDAGPIGPPGIGYTADSSDYGGVNGGFDDDVSDQVS
jgi:hypothetical protein